MNLKVSKRIHISVIKKLENKNKILQEELKEATTGMVKLEKN